MHIDFCRTDQVELLMQFFGQHWATNHVLSTSRELVDWQHYDRRLNRYNVVIAVDDTGSIAGTLGFIPTSHFDSDLKSRDTIWLTSWKVRDGAPAGLGLRLHSFLERNVEHRLVGTVGNNDHAGKIYKALGYTTGCMRQFYMLNASMDSFELCEVDEHPHRDMEVSSEIAGLQRLDSVNLIRLADEIAVAKDASLPRKSPRYFLNRYLNHPFYEYHVYLIGSRPSGLLALRSVSSGNATALRVVDYYGDDEALGLMGSQWQALLQESGAEYIDMYCYGAAEDALRRSGMAELDPDGSQIIPNHYEPFLKKNVIIQWAYKGHKGHNGNPTSVFKADADQDRPNVVETNSVNPG